MQKANAGDPIAQHSLAIQYLLGEGVEADTSKSVYWLKKAAAADVTAARYNLGIFQFNGWHTEWDPYGAFTNFLYAAESGMREAQLGVGILYTEDLIVRRNYPEALKWLSKASLAGSANASEKLHQLEKKGLITIDTLQKMVTLSNKLIKAQQSTTDNNEKALLQYIDFEADTIETPSDSVLFADALEECAGLDTLGISSFNPDTIRHKFSYIKNVLEQCAEYGNPEAITLLGRIYENGIFTGKNLLKAAYLYTRGVRVESPRAAFFLWRMIQDPVFIRQLTNMAGKKDVAATFVSARLSILGITNIPDQRRALQLLESVAGQSDDAALEAAFCYLQGKGTAKDEEKGMQMLRSLAGKDIKEAKLWYSLFLLNTGHLSVYTDEETLNKSVYYGSLPVLAVKGIMNRDGIGTTQNYALAADYFRRAASRGSASSYALLKKLYDERRPQDELFK